MSKPCNHRFYSIRIDFIDKFETFTDDCEVLSEKLNLPALKDERVHLNLSTHRSYQSYYTSELEALVYNYYREDFKQFGYNTKLVI